MTDFDFDSDVKVAFRELFRILREEAFKAGYEEGFSAGFHCEDNPGVMDIDEMQKAYEEYVK